MFSLRRGLLLTMTAVLLQASATAAATAPTPMAGAGAGDDCVPAIADSCFADVARDLACHTDPKLAGTAACRDRDATDLCMSISDALNCTSDIIDGDCGAMDGRIVYDGWLNGLRSVQRHLCNNNATNMRSLLQKSSCWSPGEYVYCLESIAGISHVTDLLTVKLDVESCGKMVRAAAACTSHTTLSCGASGALSTALVSFLVDSPCREAHCPAPLVVNHAGFQGATIAIVLLAATALVIGGALLLLTHRTSCFRIPLAR